MTNHLNHAVDFFVANTNQQWSMKIVDAAALGFWSLIQGLIALAFLFS